MGLLDDIRKNFAHYNDVCKAILKTNGIQIRDINAHNIYKEF